MKGKKKNTKCWALNGAAEAPWRRRYKGGETAGISFAVAVVSPLSSLPAEVVPLSSFYVFYA